MTYSYSPCKLISSYERLKLKEEEMLERAWADAPMGTLNSNNYLSEDRAIIVVAATQITGAGLPDSDIAGFCFRAEQAVELAVSQGGANIVLLPELWSGPYFCQSQVPDLILLADSVESSLLIKRMQLLAKLYNVVLPVSIYERSNNVHYNSVVLIDADGSIAGKYRKSHIPDGPGYQEKFYFTPGDSGFAVFDTIRAGRVGVAICWDQWFPEAARAMALQGADVLLYPTAIGSEPHATQMNQSSSLTHAPAQFYSSADHWQRVMQGHAAANMIPVVASNRFGTEILLQDDDVTEKQRIDFYGRSFITDNTGAVVAQCADNTETDVVTVVTATIDTERNRRERAAWGLFRDRRPDLYNILLTKDGKLNTNVT